MTDNSVTNKTCDIEIHITTGTTIGASGTNSKTTWGAFLEKIRHPKIKTLGESPSEADLKKIKKSAGFFIFGRRANTEQRNVQSRYGLTLDMDSAEPDITLDAIRDCPLLKGIEYIVHETFSSCAEKPKYRLIAPFSQVIDPAQYNAIATLLVFSIGSKWCDLLASSNPQQIMFMPTINSAGDNIEVVHNVGKPLDALITLDTFWADVMEQGEWNDRSTWPEKVRSRRKRQLGVESKTGSLNSGAFTEDPLIKEGPVGDFCRAYTIPQAIEKFLSDIWLPSELDFQNDGSRWYHVNGTEDSGGGVAWPHDKDQPGDLTGFTSFHMNSDPYNFMEAGRHNAFDMVRLYKFGVLDKNSKAQKETSKPSYASMVDFVEADEVTQSIRNKHAMEGFSDAEFSDGDSYSDSDSGSDHTTVGGGDSGDGGDDSGGGGDKDPSYRNAENILKRTKEYCGHSKGYLIGNSFTYSYLFNSEWNIQFCLNTRTSQVVVKKNWVVNKDRPISFIIEAESERDRIHGIPLSESIVVTMTHAMTSLMGNAFESSPKKYDIKDAILEVAYKNKFDPLMEYFDALPEWDGKNRIKSLFADYISGVEKNGYTKDVALHFMTSTVERTLDPVSARPGVVPVVVGHEGTGKSNFLRILSPGSVFFAKLTNNVWQHTNPSKRFEAVAGAMLVELEEFDVSSKLNSDQMKGMLTSNLDSIRLPYAINAIEIPRTYSYFGTTNRDDFLNTTVGTRRFAPVFSTAREVTKQRKIDKMIAKMDANRDQIWAEAMSRYKSGGVYEIREKHLGMRDKAVNESTSTDSDDQFFNLATALLDDLPPNQSVICPNWVGVKLGFSYDDMAGRNNVGCRAITRAIQKHPDWRQLGRILAADLPNHLDERNVERTFRGLAKFVRNETEFTG